MADFSINASSGYESFLGASCALSHGAKQLYQDADRSE
jgi:hypothetical protein